MKSFLFNRKLKAALAVGAALAIALWLEFAIVLMVSFGGGSLTRGFPIGMNYLSFYGIILAPVCIIAGLVATALSRLLGAGVIAIPSFFALAALLIHSFLTSDPRSQLLRVTEREGIPNLEFEQFDQLATFSDGTSYRWTARCSDQEALELISALGLESIQAYSPADPDVPISMPHPAVVTYQMVFERSTAGVHFYTDRKGLIGAFAPDEQRFRLFWSPSSDRTTSRE